MEYVHFTGGFHEKWKVKLVWSKKIPLAHISLLHTDHQLLLLKISKPEGSFYFKRMCVCPWVKRAEIASRHASLNPVSPQPALFSWLLWDEIIHFSRYTSVDQGQTLSNLCFKLRRSLALSMNGLEKKHSEKERCITQQMPQVKTLIHYLDIAPLYRS